MVEQVETLADLNPGEKAMIVEIVADGIVRRRLLDLGFRPGETVKIIRLAPLADPIEMMVAGSYLSLRRSEASLVSVQRQT